MASLQMLHAGTYTYPMLPLSNVAVAAVVAVLGRCTVMTRLPPVSQHESHALPSVYMYHLHVCVCLSHQNACNDNHGIVASMCMGEVQASQACVHTGSRFGQTSLADPHVMFLTQEPQAPDS